MKCTESDTLGSGPALSFNSPLGEAGASLVAQLVKNPPAMKETLVRFLGQDPGIPWRRNRLPTPVFLGFLCGLARKESACNAGDLGSIPGSGRSHGEGTGYSLLYSGLESSRSQRWTRLSDFDFHFR